MRTRRHAAVAALLTLAAPLALSVSGCSREPAAGPADPVVAPPAAARLLDVATLNSSEPSRVPGSSWTLTSAADDYTPQPCGVSLGSGTGSGETVEDSTATWRQEGQVAQLRLLSYPTPAQAAAAGKTFSSATTTCRSWLDAGASVEQLPLPRTTQEKTEPISAHLTRIGDDGRSESSWAVIVSGSSLISVVLVEPSSDGTSTVDAQLGTVVEKVLRTSGR